MEADAREIAEDAQALGDGEGTVTRAEFAELADSVEALSNKVARFAGKVGDLSSFFGYVYKEEE